MGKNRTEARARARISDEKELVVIGLAYEKSIFESKALQIQGTWSCFAGREREGLFLRTLADWSYLFECTRDTCKCWFELKDF